MEDKKEDKSWNKNEKQKEKVMEYSRHERHLENIAEHMKKWREGNELEDDNEPGNDEQENGTDDVEDGEDDANSNNGSNNIEVESDDAESEEEDWEIVGRDSIDASSDLQEGAQEGEEPVKERGMYEYIPLDFEKKEMRFLVLNSHPDGPKDTFDLDLVDCKFSFSTLAESEPYTYVVNTRGNPLTWYPISIDDGPVIWATTNIAVFLNHIRSKEVSQRLWFRDICLDSKNAEEKTRYWTPEWMETMKKHAHNIIDLSDVMCELWDQGKLPQPFPPREKDWLHTRDPVSTKHHPAPIESQGCGRRRSSCSQIPTARLRMR
jgi:hypothetical protein